MMLTDEQFLARMEEHLDKAEGRTTDRKSEMEIAGVDFLLNARRLLDMARASRGPVRTCRPPRGTQDGSRHLLSNTNGASKLVWIWRERRWWYALRVRNASDRGYTPGAMEKRGWYHDGVYRDR